MSDKYYDTAVALVQAHQADSEIAAADAIATAIRAAVEEEREACAQIAESFGDEGKDPESLYDFLTAEQIARRIRAMWK